MDTAEVGALFDSAAAALGVPATALAAALLASLLCGFVGTVVVLRRLVALGGGIAHAAFGGVGLALLLGFDPRLGAAGVAALAAAALAPLRSERLARLDAAIGVLWAIGMATGMLLLSGAAHSDLDVEAILFGDLTQVRSRDLALLGGFVLAMISLLLLFGRELVATAFDDEHARLQGLPVGSFSFLLLLVVALSVVALLSLVGVVLAIALLAIPPLVALRLFRSLPAIVAGGCGVGMIITVGGLAFASGYALPAGPTIILLGGLLLGLVHLAPRRALRPDRRESRSG
ncbi:MAG: metal ABC transporter permease [Thermoanaerobaculia bacterium]|nr:metal ABC transporter permease [Thermoanaerobaculia bacterium]